MRYVKRFASLLLALVMIFALGTTAFATGDGSITVDNPVAGQTYTAYRIFDVVYDTKTVGGDTVAGDHYAYTIKNNSEWFSTVQAYANDTNSGLTLTASASDSNVYVVETDSVKFSAPNFANALKLALNGMTTKPTGNVLIVSGDKLTANNLALGYYFVTSTSGALVNLTTTNPSVTIHDKNDNPFDKVDDQESVDVGQTVNYTITGKVPDTTGFTTYTWLVTDTMSDGLTFKKDVAVTIDGTDVTDDCIINYDVDSNANKFTVSIPVMNYQANVTKNITVKYSAVVNENAVAKIENNHAVLTYSNNPASGETKDSEPEEETVYSAKIDINKYEEGNEDNKLAGAEFVLYKKATTTGTGSNEDTTLYYYKWNETDKKVEWVTDRTQATVKTTDANGSASFDGLADGTYYLLETKAPAGYNLLTDSVQVIVNGASATTTNLSALTATANVANEIGTLLPSTGGMGTTLFYILGGVLVIGAAVLLVVRRRMRAEK